MTQQILQYDRAIDRLVTVVEAMRTEMGTVKTSVATITVKVAAVTGISTSVITALLVWLLTKK